MKARLLLRERVVFPDGSLAELVLWLLPAPTPERPHGLKYRLYYGDAEGRCLVRYDNKRGKGDHRHFASGVEETYCFRDVDALLEDFRRDVMRVRGANDDERS